MRSAQAVIVSHCDTAVARRRVAGTADTHAPHLMLLRAARLFSAARSTTVVAVTSSQMQMQSDYCSRKQHSTAAWRTQNMAQSSTRPH